MAQPERVWISFWDQRALAWTVLGLVLGGIAGGLVEKSVARSLPAMADACGQSVMMTVFFVVRILGTRGATARQVLFGAIVFLPLSVSILALLHYWAASV